MSGRSMVPDPAPGERMPGATVAAARSSSRLLRTQLALGMTLLVVLELFGVFDANDLAFSPLLVIATLLLRTRGLIAATAVAGLSAVLGRGIWSEGSVELVWALHPLLLLGFMRLRTPMIVAQACVAAVLASVEALHIGFVAERSLPWQVLGLSLCGGLLGGWAVGAVSAAVEALVPEIRRRAAQRYGIVSPGRRLADIAEGFAAVPILVLLLLNGVEARHHWASEAQRSAESVAARAAERLDRWWAVKVVQYTRAGQDTLDTYFGYRGLPPLVRPDGDSGDEIVAAPGLDRSRPGYVATRQGKVLALGAPTTGTTEDEVNRRQAETGDATGALAKWSPEDGRAGLEMLIPIHRDNESIGHVWTRFGEQDLRRALAPADDVDIRLGPGEGLAAVSTLAPTPAPMRSIRLSSMGATLILPVGGGSAARWSLGRASGVQDVAFTQAWQLTAIRSVMDIVAAGAGRNLALMGLVLCLVATLDLVGRRFAQRLVSRLTVASGSGGRGVRDSLIEDLAETMNYRASQLQTRVDDARQALAVREALIESVPVVLFSLRPDADGRQVPVYLSPGIEALLGRPASELMSAEGWAAAVGHVPELTRAAAAKGGGASARERVLTRVGGVQRRVHEELTVVGGGGEAGIVGVWLDIEDRKRAEEHLVQASRLVALGEMATGMAHELNQPLNAIRLAAENLGNRLARAQLPDDVQEFADTRLRRISAQAQRAATIIDRMRIFGRSRDLTAHRTPVNGLVDAAVDTVSGTLRANGVELEIVVDRAAAWVMAPAGVVEQILINLLGNACDAVLDRAARHPAEALERRVRLEVASDREHVRIRVSDTGGGVPEDIMARVFEPFFTTKSTGKGTGLGLAISYGLATDIGGDLTVGNDDDGAVFTLTLPKAPAVDAVEDAA